jgi:hypothetical protein
MGRLKNDRIIHPNNHNYETEFQQAIHRKPEL